MLKYNSFTSSRQRLWSAHSLYDILTDCYALVMFSGLLVRTLFHKAGYKRIQSRNVETFPSPRLWKHLAVLRAPSPPTKLSLCNQRALISNNMQTLPYLSAYSLQTPSCARQSYRPVRNPLLCAQPPVFLGQSPNLE